MIRHFDLTVRHISNTLEWLEIMKKILSHLLVLVAVPNLFAQDDQIPHLSLASRHYREYRETISEPVFGLAKVKVQIKKIKKDKDDNFRMAEQAYNALSLEEKFTFTMIHGEDSSQNCDAMMGVVDEEKKIFGYIPDAFSNEITWSDRQREFLTNNRSKVVSLLRSTMKTRQRVGVNLKSAIMEIKGYELIPDLISVYSIKQKDHDILSVLMLLMKEGKYPEFLKSASYEKL